MDYFRAVDWFLLWRHDVDFSKRGNFCRNVFGCVEKLVLKSEKVILTPLREDDSPILFDWINARTQVLLNAPYKPIGFTQHKAWFEAILQRRDAVIFAIRLQPEAQLIGTCQLHSLDSVHRSAELQIRLGAVAQRGQGYGAQALRLLLCHAFRDLNLHRVFLHVFQTNALAIHVYEKLGFIREGVLREAAYIDGQYLDVVVMGVLRKDYDA